MTGPSSVALARGLARPRISLVTSAALLAALAGIAALAGALGERASAPAEGEPTGTVVVGSLELRVEMVEWARHEHETKRPMPAAMMPGAPAEGSRRLHLEVSLRNTGTGARPFSQGELRLHAASGSWWSPWGSSFHGSGLEAGQRLSADLYFDVPEGEVGLFLTWTRDGRAVRIPLSGGAGSHDDHP